MPLAAYLGADVDVLVQVDASPWGLGVIAREIALDVAGSVYVPTLIRHIPGVANTVADL